MDYRNFAATILPDLDAYLSERLAAIAPVSPTLAKAMRYSVMAGGKRLRPLLLLAVIQSSGQMIDDNDLRIAGALELVHTYSLIHDDLPAMDNDDLRRGQATNHKVFGEANAILAGDGLLTLAFEWLTTSDVTAQQQASLVRVLARAAGPTGMVAGQVSDIEGQQQQLTLVQLRQLHQLKTGRLIEAAIEMGCILGQVAQLDRDRLQQFGQAFGLAFQIEDDILDVTSSVAALGKATQKDAAEQKNTFPGLLGLPAARDYLQQTTETAAQAIEQLSTIDKPLLASFLSYFDKADKK